MEGSKSISSPMISGYKLSKTGFENFLGASLYMLVVGALQYATITRPKISFSINKVYQFMSHPPEQH
uniref:Retrovirus-related Pol polyprotein from transposon TNT 1-94 n=1 Tax=Cajanus cajan TaxID=3821 RepID=A0A151RYP4_CAJCA|nr:hypothetical protein KK1_030631 [Cajanus cajan]